MKSLASKPFVYAGGSIGRFSEIGIVLVGVWSRCRPPPQQLFHNEAIRS